MSVCLEQDGEDEEAIAAFPRLEDCCSSGVASENGNVLLKVHQRRAGTYQSTFEVITASDGTAEIPMMVSATTVGSWMPKEVLLRSPWLTRCLEAPEGSTVVCPLISGNEDLEETGGDVEFLTAPTSCALTCHRVAACVLELGLPDRGAGQMLLAPRSILQCLDYCGPNASPFDAAGVTTMQLLTLFLWAVVLELPSLVHSFREALVDSIDAASIPLALATAHASGDTMLLRSCYWCLREIMCSAVGVPPAWLEGPSAVRLREGTLSYKGSCHTPLRIFRDIVHEDFTIKRKNWLTARDGYTLCQIHRHREASGAYPHTYEMRLDHSDEVVLTALREDEQSGCHIFARDAACPSSSEHCEEFLGSVVPNFWGTTFSLYDHGADTDALFTRASYTRELPLRQRVQLCRIGYETNILGDCPRKVTVDFERTGTQYHMENMLPRWDKKLNSYALPFFGRVKKASAKNFQLIVDDDANTIYLMFGKISKDVFALDYRSPLTTLDAMAIAIAALAKKRAVS